MSPPDKYAPKQRRAPESTFREAIGAIIQYLRTMEEGTQELRGNLNSLYDIGRTPSPLNHTPHAPTPRANKKGDDEDKHDKGKGKNEGKKERKAEEPAPDDETDEEVETNEGIETNEQVKTVEQVEKRRCKQTGCERYLEADARPNWVNCKACRKKGTEVWNAGRLKKAKERKQDDDEDKKEKERNKDKKNKKKEEDREEDQGKNEDGDGEGDKDDNADKEEYREKKRKKRGSSRK